MGNMNKEKNRSFELTSKYNIFTKTIKNLKNFWSIDIAADLEKYLLKISENEISSFEEVSQTNFAEAALILQGSAQIYGKKVELLHWLVHRASISRSAFTKSSENFKHCTK